MPQKEKIQPHDVLGTPNALIPGWYILRHSIPMEGLVGSILCLRPYAGNVQIIDFDSDGRIRDIATPEGTHFPCEIYDYFIMHSMFHVSPRPLAPEDAPRVGFAELATQATFICSPEEVEAEFYPEF